MRQWVAFSEAEKLELSEDITSRFGRIFSDELVQQLIHILESATFLEIDFNEMCECLEVCKDSYVVIEGNEQLNHFLEQHEGKLRAILGYKAYSVNDSPPNIDDFILYLDYLKSKVQDEGLFVVGSSFTADNAREFYLVSSNNEN